MNLFLENTNATTKIMPITNKSSDPVLTKTMKPKSARPNATNPNLSLDITPPMRKLALRPIEDSLSKTIPIFAAG